MTFVLWSIVAGLLLSGLYYLLARAYIDRIKRANERTTPIETLPDMPPRKLTEEEKQRITEWRVSRGIQERALEPYERNGRGA